MNIEYAVVKNWDDGTADVEPCRNEHEAEKMAADMNLDDGLETFVVQVIGYRPGKNLRAEKFKEEIAA